MIAIEPSDALLVVDIQNDFCPGGTLAVRGGDELPALVNAISGRFHVKVFTRDWHPANHCSFSDEPEWVDGSWPAHCVQNTPGAAFHAGLVVPEGAIIVDKATDPARENYSDFEGTGLADKLRMEGVKRLFICGIATDYCVKANALDSIAGGFDAVLLIDACRAVDVPQGSGESAIGEMAQAGVKIYRTGDLR